MLIEEVPSRQHCQRLLLISLGIQATSLLALLQITGQNVNGYELTMTAQEQHLPKDESGEKFLERDFNQCFQQLRHYDSLVNDAIKFTFTTSATATGISFAMFQFSKKEHVDLVPVAASLLLVCFFFGLFTLGVVVRTRTYFVVIARYLNEHRRFFLQNRPLGFQKVWGMYMNIGYPPYFHWRSLQVIQIYLSCALNSGLLFGSLTMFFGLWVGVLGGLAAFFTQVLCAARYLKSHEGKGGDKAIFGHEEKRSRISLRE